MNHFERIYFAAPTNEPPVSPETAKRIRAAVLISLQKVQKKQWEKFFEAFGGHATVTGRMPVKRELTYHQLPMNLPRPILKNVGVDTV